MARNNYSYQRYIREQAKKKKKEAKIQRKLEKKSMKDALDQDQAPIADIPAAQDTAVITPQ